MENLVSRLESLLGQLSGWVWGPPLLIALVGTHLYLTFRLGFIQRHLGRMIRLAFSPDKAGRGDVSHYGALATALAATVGTGNIVGVATAVAAGGPGAVFWMWMTGVFGIATKYAESLLAVKYRQVTPDGRHVGGPMYVLRDALGLPWLGFAFAVFTAVAAFGIGNMVQVNSIAEFTTERTNLPGWATGLILAALVAAVVFGGLRSIANVTRLLVPAMVVVYVGGCLVLLMLHLDRVPGAIGLILEAAFTGHAATGGFLGAAVAQAVRYGVARGLFSNESGLGSAAIVAAAARSSHPVRQALVSASATFWDTVVVCAISGITLVALGEWTTGARGVLLTGATFAHLGPVGPWLLYVALACFCFSTVLGWSYYGERAVEYLVGPRALVPYRMLWVVAVFVGAILPLQAVWDFADIANGLMVVPNLVALILLRRVLVDETRSYFERPE